ncbi:GNAT family N-acetyltransferase [Actinomadura sp. 9N407]|uniref:GNAT family N-acetyltransferase n=1 Tax=Actinomadura sp. 9N407 TaxID=3375154 RepID=UPI0037BB9B1D
MPIRHVDVTTWYLEQRDRAELCPREPRPADPAVEIVRAEEAGPELGRFLYTAVGGDWYWLDRLGWTYDQWRNWLDRPGVEMWVAYVRGTPAGYAELDPQADGEVEIVHFGLLPGFHGRGLGGRLLSVAAERAWDLADRWPGRQPTSRVWLHTCSNDGPAALANYQARGFRVYDTKVETAAVEHSPPGPWPGAR